MALSMTLGIGGVVLRLTSERRAEGYSEDTKPAGGQSDRVRKVVPRLLHNQNPHAAQGVIDHACGDESEGNDTAGREGIFGTRSTKQ